MFVKFSSILLLLFGFLEILGFSSSNTASSSYGERGKRGMVKCCEELRLVDMPIDLAMGTDVSDIQKRSADNRKPIRPVKTFHELEKSNPCGHNPCHNNGVCEWTPRSSPPFICHCPVGFIGDKCEKEIRPKNGNMSFNDVINLIDNRTATRMLAVFGGTVLGIVLIIIIHCCRVRNRKKKEDTEYLRRLQSDDVPETLPPGCCELSNVVFFETLCCLGIIKENIKKEVAEVNVDQLVSDLKLARSVSKSISKSSDRLIPDEKGSKQSLRSNRSKILSEHRINQQKRPKSRSKTSSIAGENHESYVINVEGNETDAASTKLNIENPELRKDYYRSLSVSTDGVEQTVKGLKCSCGKYTSMETSKSRIDNERPYATTSNQIIHAGLAEQNIRIPSLTSSLVGVQHMPNHGRSISELKSESHRSVNSMIQHEGACQVKGSQYKSQPTSDIAVTDKREYCGACHRNPSYQSILKTQQRRYVPDNSSGRGRRISAQTQTTPTLLSVVDQPVSPPPMAPALEPSLSSHSGFKRVDKTQNFPSCASCVKPVLGFDKSAQTQTTPTLLSVIERPISPPPPPPPIGPSTATSLSSHSGFKRVDKTQNVPSCASCVKPVLGFDKSAQTQTTPTLLSVIERPISPPPPPMGPSTATSLSSHSGFKRIDKTQNFPSCASNASPFLGFDKSAQTQITPTHLSELGRPISPPPIGPSPEPPLSSHSAFVRKDKSQSFQSCVLNLSPVLGYNNSGFTDLNKKRFSLENYTVDHPRDMQESYPHSPSTAIADDSVTYLQQSVRQGSNPTISVPHSTSLRGSERVRRIKSDEEEIIQGNYVIRSGKSANYLQDRLQENHSKSSFHPDSYTKADGKNILPNHKYSNQEYDDPTNQLSGDEKLWHIENYHPIGTRMHARRSCSQPAVFYKSNNISDSNEIYYNEYYAPKYSEYLNNQAEQVVMPIYKVPATQSLTNPYQTTYRDHFGASGVQNIRNRNRSDRQFVDSGIEVNGSRETNYSGERHGHVLSRSPQSQYHQLRDRYERSDYGSGSRREQRREMDFESRSSSREGRYDQGPSNCDLENDEQILHFLKERGSVSSFVETNRHSPKEARKSRFRAYNERRRSAPSGPLPSDYEEEDLQDDNDVIEYLQQKKTVSGLIENSRQTTPRTVVRRCENRRPNIIVNERDRGSDEEVLYNLRQRRSVSGRRGEDNQDVRERVMQNVREDYEDVIPHSMETMSNVNQELKYTKMFTTNSTMYPPAATKIGERKDIKVPIMSKNVFSPPASSENTQQRHVAENDDHTTRYQDYLRRSMIRWPVRDIDIRRSRDALKGNRLQELLNKDNSFEQPREQSHASRTPSRKAYSRGQHGNNNNIGSRADLNDTYEEACEYPRNHISQREGIQYNEEPYCSRNETFNEDEQNIFLQEVKQRGSNSRTAHQSRNLRGREQSQNSCDRSRDLPWNGLQNISHLGNDSSFYNERLNPKHSTPKASPVDPELHRIWENRNNQESGSLLERMRNSQTIQDKFFSRKDSLENNETEGNLECDSWNTDVGSRAGRRHSREKAHQNQQLVNNNQAEHTSRPGNNSLQGVPSSSFHNRVSSAFLGPQSLLGDKKEVQRQSFIGCHKSSGKFTPVYSTGRRRQFPINSNTIDSEDSSPRNTPSPPKY